MRVAALLLVAEAARPLKRTSFLRAEQKQPVEQIVPYEDSGLAATGEQTPAVSEATWKQTLESVVTAGASRFIFAADMPKVKTALEADLAKGTGATVQSEAFSAAYHTQTGNAYNLVSQMKGTDPEKFVVVGAHYDSIPATGPAPGAEDNGSGAATLLTIANALRSMGKTPAHSIEFVLFSAEEEGLIGSRAYVADNEARLKGHFQGAFILDEVSFTRTPDERLIFETSGKNAGNGRLVDTLAHSAKAAAPGVTYEVNYHGFGSDHMPFLERGLPAVLVIERDNMFFAETYGHSPKDTLERTSPTFGAHVASIVAQAVWSLANAPPPDGAANSTALF